ncbi:MAG: hypothetical protein ABL864_13420 [Terricaulis sp.]
MAKKQSTPRVSSIAGKVLSGQRATPSQTRTLAGSVLAQDEKPKGKK